MQKDASKHFAVRCLLGEGPSQKVNLPLWWIVLFFFFFFSRLIKATLIPGEKSESSQDRICDTFYVLHCLVGVATGVGHGPGVLDINPVPNSTPTPFRTKSCPSERLQPSLDNQICLDQTAWASLLLWLRSPSPSPFFPLAGQWLQ